jgi:hypothetical protein
MKQLIPLAVASVISMAATAEEPRQLYWGDTHLHTSYSFDAYLNQNDSADPDTAYRWAKGQPVLHPYTKGRVQIGEALDFLVVSDHAEAMGVLRAIESESEALSELSLWGEIKRWLALHVIRDALKEGTGRELFTDLLPSSLADWQGDPVAQEVAIAERDILGDTTPTEISAWHEIVDAAERHNDPGKFTAFLGWEWSSIPSGVNLHRVVVTPDGAAKAKQYKPFGSIGTQYPQMLWDWLDTTATETGSRFLAIPHNSNLSKGYMFDTQTLDRKPFDKDYADTRMRWEKIVEVTQYKGDSETHPELSPDDEFADFETYPFYLQRKLVPYKVAAGDYMRSALRRGLELAQQLETNPYAFGVIGSTDAHTGLSAAEEDNFWGKMARDSIPANKWSDDNTLVGAAGWNMAAAGMAAVWARENTRDALFEAMQRRETYATTGPRIRLRFFAGWTFDDADLDQETLASSGYTKGVPMGGELSDAPAATAPSFLIEAEKDPRGANLDRVQIVKGWLDADGKSQERVYNVAWSDDRSLSAQGKLPPVGNTVDLKTGRYANSIGAARLQARWEDPDFDPAQAAFYYVRALEIPTPRHSLLDALALQQELPESIGTIVQERAYSSPVWYSP